MNIVIAPDSFKECLTARQVCAHISKGIRSVNPLATITAIPIADGGEGTVDALVFATGGMTMEVESVDALMRPILSFIGILGDEKTVVIEMAAASGIGLIAPQERNPMITSTFGTGLLIKKAIDLGYSDIILGIGGSATNDGGVGMACALGYRFLDQNKNEIGHGGGSLKFLHEIDFTNVHPKLKDAKITVACDVTNPLIGIKGASVVFGPQKGANPEMVVKLDENLEYFAGLIKNQMNIDLAYIPGSGAAGGLGAGLLAFTPAELKPGFEIIKSITRLEEEIKQANLIFTAEGKIDFQTQFGKTPFGVAQIAAKYSIPVIVLTGNIGEDAEILLSKGITAYFAIANKPLTLEESYASAGILLEETAEQIMRVLNFVSNTTV